jgi:hypothetical protein
LAGRGRGEPRLCGRHWQRTSHLATTLATTGKPRCPRSPR